MVVLGKHKIVGGWLKRRVVGNIKGRVRYMRLLMWKEELWMEGEIEQMWDKFNELVVSSAVRVCSWAIVWRIMINAGWWNNEVARAVERNKETYNANITSYKWACV